MIPQGTSRTPRFLRPAPEPPAGAGKAHPDPARRAPSFWTVPAPSDSVRRPRDSDGAGRPVVPDRAKAPHSMPKDPPRSRKTRSPFRRRAGCSTAWPAGASCCSSPRCPGPSRPCPSRSGICAALTLAVWARRPGRWPATPVAWPTLAWFAALALSAWFALDRAASLPRLTKALFPLLVPLAATHARLPRRGRRALAVLLVSATLAALFGLGLYRGGGRRLAGRAPAARSATT